MRLGPVSPGIVVHPIVEGEPGIFPDPISRLMRKIGGFFDRKPQPKSEPERPTDEEPDSPSGETGASQPDRTVDDAASPTEPSDVDQAKTDPAKTGGTGASPAEPSEVDQPRAPTDPAKTDPD